MKFLGELEAAEMEETDLLNRLGEAHVDSDDEAIEKCEEELKVILKRKSSILEIMETLYPLETGQFSDLFEVSSPQWIEHELVQFSILPCC